MRKRAAEDWEKIFVFKASLQDNPDIFRKLVLLETQTLYVLAEAIIESFDFSFDHMFGFYDNMSNIGKSSQRYELFKDVGEECQRGTKGVKKVKLQKAFEKNKKLLFLFDYGDEWRFIVELVGVEKAVAGPKKYPVLLQKIGPSPEQYPPIEDEEEAGIVN